MLLVQLVYASRYAAELSLEDAKGIAQRASDRNAADQVSGMLMFGHGHFLQALEGGAEVVNAIYHRIAVDPRHRDLRLLAYREIVERDFGMWHMRHVDAGTVGPDKLRRFGQAGTFNPYQLTGARALGLLRVAGRHELELQRSKVA